MNGYDTGDVQLKALSLSRYLVSLPEKAESALQALKEVLILETAHGDEFLKDHVQGYRDIYLLQRQASYQVIQSILSEALRTLDNFLQEESNSPSPNDTRCEKTIAKVTEVTRQLIDKLPTIISTGVSGQADITGEPLKIAEEILKKSQCLMTSRLFSTAGGEVMYFILSQLQMLMDVCVDVEDGRLIEQKLLHHLLVKYIQVIYIYLL